MRRESLESCIRRIAAVLEYRWDTTLKREGGSLLRSADGQFVFTVAASKRYRNKGRRLYWYSFTRRWHDILENSVNSFHILCLEDVGKGYAIPFGVLQSILPLCRTTPNKSGGAAKWHFEIEKLDERLILKVNDKVAVDLAPFRI